MAETKRKTWINLLYAYLRYSNGMGWEETWPSCGNQFLIRRKSMVGSGGRMLMNTAESRKMGGFLRIPQCDFMSDRSVVRICYFFLSVIFNVMVGRGWRSSSGRKILALISYGYINRYMAIHIRRG